MTVKELIEKLQQENPDALVYTMDNSDDVALIVIVEEVLHSGLSIDTEADQDYVCEVIKERIKEELF